MRHRCSSTYHARRHGTFEETQDAAILQIRFDEFEIDESFFDWKKKTRSFRTIKIFRELTSFENIRSAIFIKKLFHVPRLSSGCSLYIVGKLGSGDRSNRSGSYLVVVFGFPLLHRLPADRVGARATTRKQQRGTGDGRAGARSELGIFE